MKFAFEKWHGCANDFIVFWVSRNDGDLVLDVIRRKTPDLCRRDGRGIGADGVLVLHTELRQDVKPYALTILNADGSEAAACGNGTRCAVASVLKRHQDQSVELEHGLVEFSVQDRKLICHLLDAKHPGGWPYIMVDMGSFMLGNLNPSLEKHLKKSLKATYSCSVQLGNSHVVVFQKDEPTIQKLASAKLNDVYQTANVHLSQVCKPNDSDQGKAHQILQSPIVQKLKIQTWERGVGPTQACASGASAVCAVAIDDGFISDGEWLGVEMAGGTVYCKKEEQNLTQVGPAELSFVGSVEL